jgi:hypothetical protein
MNVWFSYPMSQVARTSIQLFNVTVSAEDVELVGLGNWMCEQ